MAKGGVYRIKGDKSPLTGVKTFYNVVEWYADTPSVKRKEELVTWELYVKGENGYRSTGIKKRGINHFTFGPNAHKFSYKIEGYLHEAEGKEPMAIFVQPQKNEKVKPVEKDILGVSLTYHDGSKITKALSYMDRLKALAKCQGLEGLKIVFTLWEDDEAKEGHNTKNQYITKSPEIEVDSKGYARWNFTLFNTFISIANKREYEKKQHEYYVTAEYVGKYKSSANVNVNNPEAGKTTSPSKTSTGTKQPLPTTSPTKKPQPKPISPKSSTNPSSKNNQTDVKGIVKSVKITDKNGNAFMTNPKFGETIRITIDAKDVKGLDYNLRVWESDYVGGNDILYNGIHKFKNDLQYVLCTLTNKMRLAGEKGNDSKNPDSGEYQTGYYQEIFAEIIFMHASSKSSNINVDLTAEQKKQVLGLSTASVDKKPLGKPNSKCECQQYNLIWGNKVNCDFRKKVVKISKELWPDNYLEMANNLMAVFAWETGETFKPDVPNQKKSGATGLIQFMPERADEYFGKHTIELVPNYYNSKNKDLHYLPRVKEFAQMSAIKQLDYVKRYFNNLKGKKVGFVDFYLQVLFPVSSGKPEHFVFGTAHNKDEIGLSSDSAKVRALRVEKYKGNSGMDKSKDGKISKSEIASFVNFYKTDGENYIKIEECTNESNENKPVLGGCFQNVVKDGFLIDSKVEILKNGTTPKMTKKVEIIVLHRTHFPLKNNVKNLITNNKYPVHFWVNADGKIYQQTSLENVSYHIGVAQKPHTIAKKWGNSNSVSIEVNGEYRDKNGKRANNQVKGGYWEPVTAEQAQSVACLVSFLMGKFSLSKGDIKYHEELCAKTEGEGKTVYDAVLPLL